jgi:hypothetical protein
MKHEFEKEPLHSGNWKHGWFATIFLDVGTGKAMNPFRDEAASFPRNKGESCSTRDVLPRLIPLETWFRQWLLITVTDTHL